MNRQAFDNQADILLALRNEKEKLRKELRTSHKRMTNNMHELFAPAPATTNKVQGFSHMISNGLAIYEGLKIGLGFIRATRGLFGVKRRKRF